MKIKGRRRVGTIRIMNVGHYKCMTHVIQRACVNTNMDIQFRKSKQGINAKSIPHIWVDLTSHGKHI